MSKRMSMKRMRQNITEMLEFSGDRLTHEFLHAFIMRLVCDPDHKETIKNLVETFGK